MSMEHIRAFRNARPFTPFTILMKNGRLIEIELPERISLSPRGKVVAVSEGKSVSLLEVSEMRAIQPAHRDKSAA